MIEIKQVRFQYEQDQKTPHIFKDFNLSIEPGQKVGLVGESGAGKSTFVNLLIRFMDTTNGEILINGQNISALTQDDLRRNITYVPQEPILFHRSLKENIAYGNPDASGKAIIQAAKHAYAHDFILEFPEQYDTLVDERGGNSLAGKSKELPLLEPS